MTDLSLSPQHLVERFYHDLWNKADEAVAYEILHPDFKFRGSLGQEKTGPDGFIAYMKDVHRALGDYQCIIDNLVVDKHEIAAQMTFKGIHRAPFFNIEATEKEIIWKGAAFFKMNLKQITDLWVLGDIDHIKQQLELI